MRRGIYKGKTKEEYIDPKSEFHSLKKIFLEKLVMNMIKDGI